MNFNENKRQIEHITPVFLTLLLRWLEFKWALLCGVGGLLYGIFGSRLFIKDTQRPEEQTKGFSMGKIAYGLSVVILILLFYDKRYAVAGGWALLSMGDGFSTLIGRNFGKKKLPWNPDKSWIGSGAFIFFGGLGAFGVMLFVSGGQPEINLRVGYLLLTSIIAAIICAALESIDWGIDDNVTVPLVGGAVIYAIPLLSLSNISNAHGALKGISLSLGLGASAYLFKMVSISGLAGGVVIGSLIYLSLGLPGFMILLLFFMGGSLATKFGYSRKSALGVAQEDQGRRSSRHAVAKCSAGLIMSGLALFADSPLIFQVAFVGAFATALFDTISSEMGQLYGKTPILLTSFKMVPVGTEGAVSLEGTLCGLLASGLMACAGSALGLIPIKALFIVVVSAFLANALESVLGTTLERSGAIGNEGVNFLNTSSGALLCVLFSGWVL